MSNSDGSQETPPVSGHTVIEPPKGIALPPEARDNPPAPGHTVIKGDRPLDEPTPKAEEIRQKTGA